MLPLPTLLAAFVGTAFLGAGSILAQQAGASYGIVAFTGQSAPGGGTFSTFGLPKIGADGTVAFIDGVGGESITARVVASRFGERRLVAAQGQTIPEGDATYASFSSVSVSKDGDVAFNASAYGGEVTIDGIWGEGVAFSIPDTFINFGPVAFRAGNLVGLKGEISVDPESETTNEVLSILDGKGATDVLSAGQFLPGLSGDVLVRRIFEASESSAFSPGAQAGTEVDVNESGNVALKVVTTPGPSPTPTTVQSIYVGEPAALKRLATSGSPAPGLSDLLLKNLSPLPSIASSGEVAFSARLSGDNARNSAVFAGRPGDVKLIAKASDPVPTASGVTFDDVFSSVVVNETGDVIFKATIRYPNDTTRDGIWIQRRSGSPVLIAADGISLPTPNGDRAVTAVDFAGPGTFNDLHQFVFRASFADGEGIYLADTRAVAPWVRPTFPRKPRDRVTREKFLTIRGTAQDDTGIEKVEYSVVREGKSRGKVRRNAGRPVAKLAKGDRSWGFKVPLSLGKNRIAITATDRLGNVSEPLILVILRY